MVSGDDSLPDYLMEIFQYMDPIYQFHCGFLKELEQRLSMWEGKSNAHLNGDYQKIGDIMVNSFLTSLGVSIFTILSHNNPCSPCTIAITNFLVLHMCEVRFHDVIDRTVHMCRL